jgi:NAD+ diphosphatase
MDDPECATASVFVSGVRPPPVPPVRARWFRFRGSDLLVHAPPAVDPVPVVDAAADPLPRCLRSQYLGQYGDAPCFSGELSADAVAPAGMEFIGLRQLFGRVPDPLFWLAARAVQIVDWDRTHQFCGRCGAPTQPCEDERARSCPGCRLQFFPRLSPAVIVSIVRGAEILLARAHRLPPGLYSVVAGFVEPGETLEEAVVREVREEVGVNVRNLRYFGSQPWPFPNSLMIAFTAEWASGEIRLDEREIADARWFRFDALPPIPGPLSVARRLIDRFLADQDTA